MMGDFNHALASLFPDLGIEIAGRREENGAIFQGRFDFALKWNAGHPSRGCALGSLSLRKICAP